MVRTFYLFSIICWHFLFQVSFCLDLSVCPQTHWIQIYIIKTEVNLHRNSITAGHELTINDFRWYLLGQSHPTCKWSDYLIIMIGKTVPVTTKQKCVMCPFPPETITIYWFQKIHLFLVFLHVIIYSEKKYLKRTSPLLWRRCHCGAAGSVWIVATEVQWCWYEVLQPL